MLTFIKVKYIIIPGINDTLEEINEFLKKIKEFDIRSIVLDVEYTYANRNIGNISPHIYMLMDYIENFAKNNNINYELYDSAKYASISRNYEPTTDFEISNFKSKFEEYKNNNVKQNIQYNI